MSAPFWPALYVDLDDRVLPALCWNRDHRPGRKPVLSDAELLCLAVAQPLLGIASERWGPATGSVEI